MSAPALFTVSYGDLIRRNRNFRFFWGGQIVSQLGDWFSAITVNALLLKYTGRTDALAGYMVAALLPNLLLGPVAGVVVDRFPRKTVMIVADLLRALIALGLLFFRGPETVWVAFACIAGMASLTAFFEPARIATLPNITQPEELVTANALSSVTWSILLTSGAMVGGIIGHFFGPSVSFLMNSLSFVGSALLFAGMRVPPTEATPEHERKHGLGQILDGLAYVRRHPEVLRALSAKLGWGLAGGVQVLLPVFGAKVFPMAGDKNNQLGISFLFAANGLGTALGPVIARRFTGRDLDRTRWAIAVSFLVASVWYACMAGAPNLWTTGLFLGLARMHGAIIWVFSTLLLQMLVADRFRGRVFAAETSLFTLTMMLSSVATSRALDTGSLTVPKVMLAMASLSAVVGLFWVVSLLKAGQAGKPAEEVPVPDGG